MSLFLFFGGGGEEVAVDAEQWPMQVLPVVMDFAGTFHIQASVIPSQQL